MNDEKTVVISGGSGYLGSAIARTFSENGFRVVVIDKETADISKEAAVKKIAKEIKEQHGEIFAIIHAASAPLVRKSVLSLSEEDFEKQFLVNVLGGFHLFKYFGEFLSSDGAIIGIASSILFPGTDYPKSGSYTAAKFGLQGLLKTIAGENSFRVYSVAPAFMPGGLNGDLPLVVREMIVRKSGIERTTRPDNVASAILLLANDTEKKWAGKTIAMPGFFVKPL